MGTGSTRRATAQGQRPGAEIAAPGLFYDHFTPKAPQLRRSITERGRELLDAYRRTFPRDGRRR